MNGEGTAPVGGRGLARARAARRGSVANDRCARWVWDGGSAAGYAHVPRDGGGASAPVDDEVVPLGLAQDRGIDRGIDEIDAFRSPQWRAQIGGILLTEAHIERAGAGEAHAVAGFA